jgi:hypothetical protein
VLPQYTTLVSQTSSPNLTFNNATSGELVWTRNSMNAGDTGTIRVCAQVSVGAPTKSKANNVVNISGSFDRILTGNNVHTDELTFGEHKVFLPIIER